MVIESYLCVITARSVLTYTAAYHEAGTAYLARVARYLWLKNAKLNFKTGKILDFTIESSRDLKKVNCLINYQFQFFDFDFNFFLKGQICVFGIEKAKPGNPVSG